MTVVFLYMGDHFNMLIRPYLWSNYPSAPASSRTSS